MRRTLGSKAGAGLALLAMAFVLATGLQIDAQVRGEVKAFLDQGVSLYDQGRLDEAEQQFERALLLDPTSEEALTWVEEVGYQKLIKIIRSQNADLGKQITTLLNLTARETNRKKRDEALIESVLRDYFDEGKDIQARTATIYRAVNEHGVYLMPGLVERLAVQELRTRVAATLAISKISDDAVLPLTRALHHPDSHVVQGAIGALGKIGNPAAIPSLKYVAETTSDMVVQGAAIEAIRKLDRAGNSAEASAYDLLVAQAGQFFRNPSYMFRSYHDPIVWKLENGALSFEEVHSWLTNELRAEQLIQDALALDGTAAPARVMNVCNRFAQYSEYDAVLHLLEKQGNEPQKNQLESESLRFAQVRMVYPYGQPGEILSGALGLAMAENRPEVAIEAITALREAVTQGERATHVPVELQEALSFAHRGVRFAAAECIAYMNPESGFAGSELVVENLSEGLAEAGARVALTILNEDDALHVASLMRVAHVWSFNELDGLLGLNRAKSFPPEDLIVIGSELPDMPTAKVIQELRSDYRTKDIPIFVLATDANLASVEATYLDESRNVHVLHRSIDPSRLRDDKLAPLWADDSSERGRSIDIARRGAQALQFLASHGSSLDLGTAEAALVTVLENRADRVRVEACRALGNLRTKRATAALVRLCNDSSISSELHEAALMALGAINAGDGAEAIVSEVLEKGLMSEDVRIVKAAAISKGKIAPASM